MVDDATPSRDSSSRKRDQVRKAQRTMFFWVAGMSVVVGFSLVAAWFLWQQLVFRTTVVNKKIETVTTLQKNNEAIPKIKEMLRVRETSQALQAAKANPDERALQVILDALPSENNSLALGASIQEKLAGQVPNLTVESLSTGNQSSGSVIDGGSGDTVPFRIVVSSSDVNALKELLTRFERSIRVIDINALTLDSGGDKYTLTIDAHAYYQPEKILELQKKKEVPK